MKFTAPTSNNIRRFFDRMNGIFKIKSSKTSVFQKYNFFLCIYVTAYIAVSPNSLFAVRFNEINFLNR